METTRDDVTEYIQRKGWEIQKTEGAGERKHLVLKVCPICGKHSKNRSDRNFYICEENGLWNTYCCDRSGNLFTLKRELGDLDVFRPAAAGFGTDESARFAARLKKAAGSTWANYDIPPVGTDDYFHQKLREESGREALEYLTAQRGFTDKTIDNFNMGVARRGFCEDCKTNVCLKPGDTCQHNEDHKVVGPKDMIAIPYYSDGRLVNFKFRTFVSGSEKRFEKWTGAPTTLFNEASLDGEWKQAVVCEAEFDAITLNQCGFHSVVAVGGSQKNLEDSWVERLALFDDVLLAYDNDDAGNKGATNAAAQLGKYRCRRVQFPLKDANECLQSGVSPDDIRACVDAAAGYKINSVKPFEAFADDLRDMKTRGPAMFGKQTRWYDFNRLIGGLRDGELTVVTGDTSSGKTTWTSALAWDMARGDRSNHRDAVGVLIASFEMPVKETCRKLLQMEVDENFGDMTDEELEDGIRKLSALNLFFVDQYGDMPLADLRDAIEYGVRRYELWLVVLDHLHFFLQNTNDERRSIDVAVREIKRWCVRLGVHMVLVVHPSKLRIGEDGRPMKVELNDLKGASSIKQDADNVVRVWRDCDPDKTRKGTPYAEIASLKCRSDFGQEGALALHFDPASLRYTDPPHDADPREDAANKGRRKGKGKKSGDAQTEFAMVMQENNSDNGDNEQVRTLFVGGQKQTQAGSTDGE